jgi:hypothetical protein
MEGYTIVGDAWNGITQEASDSFCIDPKYMAKSITNIWEM